VLVGAGDHVDPGTELMVIVPLRTDVLEHPSVI
jgi:hypothetical protein